jgi:serine/threonine protein kinase/formylglycine-generating enzyme required for sulfatase activity
MNPERWEEVQRLFARALEIPEEERGAFVQRETGGDQALAQEVLRMLGAQPKSDFIEAPPELAPEGPDDPPLRMGDFDLFEEIGRGGMGVVYRAQQRSLNRVVAVKVLPQSLTLTARQIDRFQREARAAARLQHPNVVTVLTVGAENGTRFFAMEYVRGQNLAEELKRLREQKGVEDGTGAHLPSSQAETYFRSIAELMRQAANGLHYAHQHGIVHRDVKPSNLLLDELGNVRIVDFGLARDEEQGSITKSGELAGTPHYMSPEQARASRRHVDHRTDVYSLGVVMYELLTLRRPFEGRTSQEILDGILQREAPKVRRLNPRVPRDLAVICSTAMAKSPAQRYPSAAELRDDLTRFLNLEAIHAQPPSFWQVAAWSAYRHRRSLAAAVIALAALGVGVLYAGDRARRARISEHLEVLRLAHHEGPLESLPLARALDVRRRIDDLRPQRSVLPAEEDDVVGVLEGELEDLRVGLRRRGLEDLTASKDGTQPEGVREMRRLTGLQTLLRASHLFPEDEDLRRLASVESGFPTIAVRALGPDDRETGADVYLREINVFSSGVGDKHFLGHTPLPPTPVVPGYYRVIVVFADGGFRELVCNPGPAFMELALVAKRRADEAVVSDGMVLVPAVEYVFPEFDGERGLQGRAVHLDEYWVDSTEVSNAQYAAFLGDTGRPVPYLWKQQAIDVEDLLQRGGELPVTGMTWSEAVAYAEWAGKRLLTVAEWHRAAGGPENWPWPYSADPDAPPRGNVFAPEEPSREPGDWWNHYLRFAAPVRSYPEARTSEGLFHMYGNVKELTESMAVVLADESTLVPRPFDRFFLGATWSAQVRKTPMRSTGYWGIGPHYVAESIGFRCAKSAAP